MCAEAKSYLTLNLLKPLSGQCGASQNQQKKFMGAYLDLGNLPIKQNKAVEQHFGGPLGADQRLKFTLQFYHSWVI